MKAFTVLFVVFAAVLLTTEFTVKTSAVKLEESKDPHENEIYLTCGNRCGEKTCHTIKLPEDLACSKMCEVGYYCKDGYVRAYEDGPCISPDDCGIFNRPQ